MRPISDSPNSEATRSQVPYAALGHIALLYPAIKPADSPHEEKPTSNPALLQSYQEILRHVPIELRQTKATEWTDAQRDKVNDAFKAALSEPKMAARLTLKVANIADWNGMTLSSELLNPEGYKILAFCKFSDEWKQPLRTVAKGETVIVNGVISSVTYRNLWGRFTLSINLKDCTFTRR